MLKIKSLENFGVIKKSNCEIELNDLTIFMGDNSSGKSYLAMLFAGSIDNLKNISLLSKFANDLYTKLNKNNKIFKDIELLNENKKNNTKESEDYFFKFDIDNNKELSDLIDKTFLEIINRYIFDSKVSVDNIEIVHKSKNIYYYMLENSNAIRVSDSSIFLKIDEENSETLLKSIIERILLELFLKHKKIEYEENSYTMYSRLYLPASRTGFLQTYKVLNRYAREKTFIDINSNQNDDIKLNRLTLEFIDLLDNVSEKVDNKIANFIQKEILKGYIKIEQSSTIRFFTNEDKEVEKHLLSSTVSELVPLVAFLKNGSINRIDFPKFLVIEEPEAHLSFANQRVMAKVIAMLVNEGIKVLITTHSDFLVYELNNLMKKEYIKSNSDIDSVKEIVNNSTEYDKDEKQEYIKEIDETYNDVSLDSKRVSIYNFLIEDDGMSVIDSVEVDKYGIESDYIFESTKSVVDERSRLYDIMDLVDNANNK
jgi:predicted ATPase